MSGWVAFGSPGRVTQGERVFVRVAPRRAVRALVLADAELVDAHAPTGRAVRVAQAGSDIQRFVPARRVWRLIAGGAA